MTFQINNQSLITWFQENKRVFPWRDKISPYATWISEVMLQQTRAEVVVPFFLRWMRLFPTVETLAKAPIETVIKAWEGLGYYRRARYLHSAACSIMENHNGILPNTLENLQKIKGMGPYTVGAILSFAYKKKIAAVDGNVLRVLARHFEIGKEIDKQSTQKEIRDLAESILPEKESWIVNEALIELGATLYRPNNPHCTKAPSMCSL